MFSFWIGKLFGYDIREYGDGNPGATNAFKAAGIKAGFPSLLLDFLKGAIPLFIAFWILQINDWRLIPLSIAPILGHSFSPFLKFRGGKAIAVTFGVWSGITLWEIPVVLGLSLSFFTFILIFEEDGWRLSVIFSVKVK
jgi:glycerol-3-phosphate acyltransferase PlsY